MKNIIGNSCVSAFITNDLLHQQFINPFCWATLDFKSMYNLIKYYDYINWKNYEIIKDKKWMFYTIVDNKVKIRWVHYKFSPNDKILKRGKPDIKYCKIWEYINDKYNIRINRMLKYNIEPIFIVRSLHKGHWYTKDEIKQICDIKSKYKIIIVNNNYDFSKEYPNIIFHTTHFKEDGKTNNSVISKELFEKYKILSK